MFVIRYPDRFHLDAAQGWLMLGNPTEAFAEFAKLSRPYSTHPDYLEMQCRLLIAKRDWRAALRVSRRQIRFYPGCPQGWINQAYCLHELQRTREAVKVLLPAAERFPDHDLITFNLACYCCHLKDYKAALAWVNRTIALVDSEAGFAV